MSPTLLTILGILVIGLVFVVMPIHSELYFRHRKPRKLRCPNLKTDAKVQVDPWRSALTAGFRKPTVRVHDCSLWPVNRDCEQDCIKGF